MGVFSSATVASVGVEKFYNYMDCNPLRAIICIDLLAKVFQILDEGCTTGTLFDTWLVQYLC